MRIVRATSLVSQPWRNGLGTTRSIHVEEGWQVSVADLGDEADFSPFEGQDRVFTLIEGGNAMLDLAGGASVSCRLLVPVIFPGDVPARYRPAVGSARAFNVIASRGLAEPRVRVCSLSPGRRVPQGETVVFCVEGQIAVGAEVLGAADTAVHPGSRAIEVEGPAVAILVSLRGAGCEPFPAP